MIDEKKQAEFIIEDLRDFGVKIGELLACNPTFEQLRDMRDGLARFSDASKVIRRYRFDGELMFVRC